MNMQDYNRVYQRVHIRAACRNDILRDGASGTPRRITHRRASLWDYAPALTGLAACLMLLICGGIILSGLREGGLQGPTSSETEITSDTAMPYTDTTTAQTQTTARTVSQPEATSDADTTLSADTTLTADTTLAATDTTLITSDTDATGIENGNAPRFEVRVVREDTSALLSNVNVLLEKRWYRDEAGKSHWECYTGKTEVFASWNTSDVNPYISASCEWTPDNPFDVYAVIRELPKGYSYYGREIAEYSCGGDLGAATKHSITLKLRKEKYADTSFPITGTYSVTYQFKDAATGEQIKDLDCVFMNVNTGEELFRWNTTEQPEMTISNLNYRFEDWHMNNTIRYAIRFLNMPENYVVFYGKSHEIVYQEYNADTYESGEERFEETILLENTAPDAPAVTYISGTSANG